MTTPGLKLQATRHVSTASYRFFGSEVIQLSREQVVSEIRRMTTCYPHISVSVRKDLIFHSEVFVVTAVAYVTDSDVGEYPELKEGGLFS